MSRRSSDRDRSPRRDDRDRDRDRRDRDGDRDRDRERRSSREKDRERRRSSRSRSPARRDRDRDRDSHRDRERDREKDRERDRDRDERRGDRDRDRRDDRMDTRDDNDRGKNEKRDRERERPRDRERPDRPVERERDRDTHTIVGVREDRAAKKEKSEKTALEKMEIEKRKKEDEQRAKDDYSEFEKAMAAHKEVRAQAAPADVGKGAAPISLETLEELAKRKAQDEVANLKPVFLSKEDRKKLKEQAALERLAAAREEEKKTSLGMGSSIQAAIESAKERRERQRRERQEELERDKERQIQREKSKGEREHEKMQQVLKDTYLGKAQKKKRIVPPSQKFKFSFDWEAGDDTSIEINPIYDRKAKNALLFGRGFIGGVDHRDQRKQQKFYEELIKAREQKLGLAAGASSLDALKDQDKVAKREAQAAKKAADQILANRHWTEKKLEEMEERDWRIFKEDFSIQTRGPRVPHPLRYWTEAGLPAGIMKAIERAGYTAPTPIQRAAIPVGLRNLDVVGIAETGSGKTAAFLIPMLVYISTLPKLVGKLTLEGPYAVALAPTRELAQQISDEATKLGLDMGIRNVAIVGGQSIEEQGFSMRDGAEIVVATPGRLYDCIEKRYLVLNQCNYIVLDEADRMIDLNFEPQLIKILESMPSSNVRPDNFEEVDEKKIYRQTIMFSATMPLKVEMLAKKYLRHPVFIAIGDRKGKVNTNIEQRVEMIPESRKKSRLLEILTADEPPFIVFCNSKKACDSLSRHLDLNDITNTVLHGGKIQETREHNLEAFKEGKFSVLIATDVVGRGIDISGVQQVINFEMPGDIEKYQHRIGRTGRAGKTGIATSFVTDQDTHIYFDLKAILEQGGQEVPPELARHEASKVKPGSVVDKPKKSTTIFAA